jgi:hypothetical protein
MAANHETLDPHRSIVGVERETAGLLEEGGENCLRFKAGEWCTDAVMDAAPKCGMASRHWSIQYNHIGVGKRLGISIGRAPEKKQRGTSRNVDLTKLCVIDNGTHVQAERRLQTQHFLDEAGNQFAILTKAVL